MSLSFDPDWRTGGWSSSATVTITNIPNGNPGDTVAMFVTLGADVVDTAGLERDSGGATLQSVGFASSSYPTATPTRRQGVMLFYRSVGFFDLRVTFASPVAGAYTIMNLPPGQAPVLSGGYEPQGTAQPLTSPAVISPAFGPYNILIGAATSADIVTLTESGAGEFDMRNNISSDWMRTFIFETSDPAATVTASASSDIRFWRLLSATYPSRKWWVGVTGWS